MSRVLVSYFSASGETKRVAEKIASTINGDLFEIEPKEKYTDADLDWTNKQSRSSVEMKNKSFRQKMKENHLDISSYDTILIGFPIWWGVCPTVVNTFIESKDFTGKTLIPFCTSGGSGMSYAESNLRKTYPNYNWKAGKRLTGRENDEDLKNWIN